MELFVSTLVLFFLVLDPIGNLPMFISILDVYESKRYAKIIARESLIALGVMVIFMIAGQQILDFLQISHASLEVAGGIILFMIAVKLVFGYASAEKDDVKKATVRREPYIVPLAIPLIAGPGTLSTAIIIGGRGLHALPIGLLAMFCAWLLSTIILLSGRRAAKLMGDQVLSALESLAGLLLTAIAVGMILDGIKMAFNL